MDTCKEPATCLLREIEHHVAQKNDVELLMERQQRLAEIGLLKLAQVTDLGLDNPVLTAVVEVTSDVTRRKTAVHFDAVVEAPASTLDRFRGDVSSLDANVPRVAL